MKDYKKDAQDFLNKVNAKVTINFLEKGRVPQYWNEYRLHNIYKVTIKRNGKQYTYKFYDSIYNTQNNIKPDAYDVLVCLEKYDVGSFEEFCSEFGYDEFDDYGRMNKTTKKIYNAVVREFKGVERVFGDVLEEFAEIC